MTCFQRMTDSFRVARNHLAVFASEIRNFDVVNVDADVWSANINVYSQRGGKPTIVCSCHQHGNTHLGHVTDELE